MLSGPFFERPMPRDSIMLLTRTLYSLPFALLLFCMGPWGAVAQEAEPLAPRPGFRTMTVLPGTDTLFLDSLSLVRGSFKMEPAADSSYVLYEDDGFLVWRKPPPRDSVRISYRVLPFSFTKKYAHKDRESIRKNISFPEYKYSMGDSAGNGSVTFNSLEYNGSYGRSLTIGNSQDVSLNSQFNLQLNGYILDSVKIEAALSDNNLPIQPDGNTQKLQEFDQLFITFEKGGQRLTAGDYVLERPNAYFMNFYKKAQGLFYQGAWKKKDWANKVGLSGSIAKGQFARNILMGVEGNQGPYKLQGNNGEQFFVVLAGSEKVYIDGILMERGEDRDYVINYNTGEVTFMPRQWITKDKRLQFEFEYQDRNYLNTLLYAYDEFELGKKLQLRLHAYSNQDAKNQPYVQNLSAEQKQFLGSIGDDIDRAFYRNIVRDTFSASKILYKMVDSLVGGVRYDSVFVYSTDKDSALYSLGFSYVGEQKGHYIIATANTNGRSYSWVPPLNGVPQGNYEPVVLLITPKMQQMFSLGGTYRPDSLKKIDIEVGGSNYAPNLFSDLDKDKHWGGALKGAYEEMRLWGKKDTLGKRRGYWKNRVAYEFVQSRFKAIAPYRNVEFARDWNIDIREAPEDEQLADVQTEWGHRDHGSVGYMFSWFKRGQSYRANRHIFDMKYDRKGWSGLASFNVMHAEDLARQSTYIRPSLGLEKAIEQWGRLTLGARYDKEHNAIRDPASGLLLPNAFAFDKLRLYLFQKTAGASRWGLNYTYRKDDYVDKGIFMEQSRSHTVDADWELVLGPDHRFAFTGGYRRLIVPQEKQGLQDGGSVLGRVSYEGNIGKGALTPSLLYEAGSGQEQKRIYTYVEVPVGQGVYTWVDYNGDGVQQANEFELAQYPDQRKYIRLITPTNEFVKVNYMLLNLSLQISPEAFWAGTEKKKGWRSLLSRFSDQVSLQINNRVLSEAGARAFSPFAGGIGDTDIIANVTGLANTLYFNRNDARWGGEYTVGYNSGRSLLTYGLEGNDQLRHLLRGRLGIGRNVLAQVQLQKGERSYRSALEDGRSYHISSYWGEPGLTWTWRTALRVSSSLRWEDRKNGPQWGGETATIRSLNLEARTTFKDIGNIQAKGTYSMIRYDGAERTPVSFIMLDALQKGDNWIWYFNWERRLGKGLELSIEYEGRKPGSAPVVHTGRMSVRALL